MWIGKVLSPVKVKFWYNSSHYGCWLSFLLFVPLYVIRFPLDPTHMFSDPNRYVGHDSERTTPGSCVAIRISLTGTRKTFSWATPIFGPPAELKSLHRERARSQTFRRSDRLRLRRLGLYDLSRGLLSVILYVFKPWGKNKKGVWDLITKEYGGTGWGCIQGDGE